MSPRDLGHRAAEAAAAGATEIHVHPTCPCGRDGLSPRDLTPALEAPRAEVPVPVGVTTGAWAEPGPAARLARVRSWSFCPTSPRSTGMNRARLNRPPCCGNAVSAWRRASGRARTARPVPPPRRSARGRCGSWPRRRTRTRPWRGPRPGPCSLLPAPCSLPGRVPRPPGPPARRGGRHLTGHRTRPCRAAWTSRPASAWRTHRSCRTGNGPPPPLSRWRPARSGTDRPSARRRAARPTRSGRPDPPPRAPAAARGRSGRATPGAVRHLPPDRPATTR